MRYLFSTCYRVGDFTGGDELQDWLEAEAEIDLGITAPALAPKHPGYFSTDP